MALTADGVGCMVREFHFILSSRHSGFDCGGWAGEQRIVAEFSFPCFDFSSITFPSSVTRLCEMSQSLRFWDTHCEFFLAVCDFCKFANFEKNVQK